MRKLHRSFVLSAAILAALSGSRASAGTAALAWDAVSDADLAVDPESFAAFWQIDRTMQRPGGLAPPGSEAVAGGHVITMLQRRAGRFGDSLGRSTGWIHRLVLGRHGVETIAGAEYRRIDDAGLHVVVAGAARCIRADTIIICAGQEPLAELAAAVSGGADEPTRGASGRRTQRAKAERSRPRKA